MQSDNKYSVKVKWLSGDITDFETYDLEGAYRLVNMNKDCSVVQWVGVNINGACVACYKGGADVEVLSA